MGLFNTAFDRIANRFGYVRAKPDEVVKFDVRNGVYSTNQMLYDGTVYQTLRDGGALEDILRTYIGQSFCDVNTNRIQPFFDPFKEIVDTYLYVLPGTWGNEVKVADEVDGRPVNSRVIEPLQAIWLASNFDAEKAKLIRWGANFGTVGMRVTARPAVGDRPARVSIVTDHPSRLFNFEEDSEKNITAVALKYRIPINRGTLADPTWESVEVVETITKEDFSLRYDGEEQLDDAARVNNLGFCPYVVLRHKDNGTQYGDWAYRGTEPTVHRINWRASRQDKSIDRNQFPRWFLTGGGDKPEEVDLGDSKGHYVQTAEGTPPPSMEAIVPKLDQAGTQAFWSEMRDMVSGRQPELNLNAIKMLANLSGEALAQILKPTEKTILDVRPNYWHAVIRAMQMAVSAGIQVGAWDIGTGTGDQQASDAAFQSGKEAFTFAPIPALPPTVYQLQQQASAETAQAKAKLQLAQQGKAINLPDEELWRLAGYASDQNKAPPTIEELKKMRENADTLITNNAVDSNTL